MEEMLVMELMFKYMKGMKQILKNSNLKRQK